MINAGLLVDLPHLEHTGATGIGLFRTELQFMVATAMPRIGEQLSLYRAVLDAAGKKPVTFRTLDIGGDKVLPYMRSLEEENPALGWRAIRLGLDRPGLMRSQIRALLRASSGRALKLMFPMVAVVDEFDQAKAMVENELTHLRRHGHGLPERVEVGVMVEVPSLLLQLDELLPRVDFLSVGSNDLLQFLYAVDRGNTRVADRFDIISAPMLRALRDIADQSRQIQEARHALRRDGVEADRRFGPGRARLSLALAHAVGGRSGQGHAAGSRCRQGRSDAAAADRQALRLGLNPQTARRIRRCRRPATVRPCFLN